MNGLEKDKRPGASLFSSDTLQIVLKAGMEEIGEARMLEILQEAGIGPYPSMSVFFSQLNPGVSLPGDLCASAYGLTLRECAAPEKMAEHFALKRGASALYYLTLLRGLSLFTGRQNIAGRMDLVTMSYLAQSRVEWMISNCLLIDAHLEMARGASRRVVISHLLLHDDMRTWTHHLTQHYVLRLYPVVFREQPARVRQIHRPEIEAIDPLYPDEPLRMGRRPGLMEISERHGLGLTETPRGLTMNGKLLTMPDFHPARCDQRPIHRVLNDVALSPGGGGVILGPSREGRPLQSLILAAGHRHGIDFEVPTMEFEASFEVRSKIYYLIWPLLYTVNLMWGRLGGSGGDPWEMLAEQIRPSDMTVEPGDFGESGPVSLPSESKQRLSGLIDEYGLSPRESEVIDLVVKGRSNPEIAREFGITEITVKTHMKNIFQKTGFKNRKELFAFLHSGERSEEE